MAKRRGSRVPHDTGNQITTESRYGSHEKMVVEYLDDGEVVCIDDSGYYKTIQSRLDNGLADPNRYSINARVLYEENTDD